MSSPPPPGPGGTYQGGEYGSGEQPQQPPSGAPQQPTGQPPFQPGGQGFPPQQQPGPGQQFQVPQQPGPGQQFQVPQQFPPADAQPEKKKRGALIGALVGVGGLVLVAIVGFVVRGALFGADVPEVGECINNPDNPNDIEVVDCTSSEAAFEVIGLDGEMTESAFDEASAEEVCTSFPEWEQAVWYGTGGDDGEVVCVVTTG
jgi:hypothetical protein